MSALSAKRQVGTRAAEPETLRSARHVLSIANAMSASTSQPPRSEVGRKQTLGGIGINPVRSCLFTTYDHVRLALSSASLNASGECCGVLESRYSEKMVTDNTVHLSPRGLSNDLLAPVARLDALSKTRIQIPFVAWALVSWRRFGILLSAIWDLLPASLEQNSGRALLPDPLIRSGPQQAKLCRAARGSLGP